MQFSFVTLCLVLAIFSLLVVSGYLVSKQTDEKTSSWLLAGFLIATTLTLANFLYAISGAVMAEPVFGFIGNTLGLSAAPLLYLYAKSLAQAGFRIRPALLWHFAPVIGFLLAVISAYTIQPGSIKLKILSDPNFPSAINTPLLPLAIFGFVFFYLAMTVKLLFQHRSRFRQHYASSVPSDLAWLRISVTGALIIWTSSLFHQVAVAVWPLIWLDRFFVVSMAGSAFIFSLYFLVQALRQTSVAPASIPILSRADEKYGVHRITDAQVDEFAQSIETHFAESKPYLDASLSLSGLANTLPMTPRELSQTINRRYQQSFFDFVNERRVNYAREQLFAHPDKTITEIMTESGFNSKSSFYSAFKKVSGQTPSQYRASSNRTTHDASPETA